MNTISSIFIATCPVTLEVFLDSGMAEAELTQDVAEAFMHFYYDSLLTDLSRLQSVVDQSCKFVYRTCKPYGKESQYDSKKDPQAIMKALEIIYRGVEKVDILMWTPVLLEDSITLVVSAKYQQKAKQDPLLTSEVLVIGKNKQKQKRGFSLLAITTHIIE